MFVVNNLCSIWITYQIDLKVIFKDSMFRVIWFIFKIWNHFLLIWLQCHNILNEALLQGHIYFGTTICVIYVWIWEYFQNKNKRLWNTCNRCYHAQLTNAKCEWADLFLWISTKWCHKILLECPFKAVWWDVLK